MVCRFISLIATMSMLSPKILALDASSEACSVALLVGEEIQEDFRMLPRAHTQFLLPMLDQLLAASELRLVDLDAIAFSAGPGSFTGLRVAAATVQGLAFSAELPVLTVSTLASVAQAWFDGEGADYAGEGARVSVALDARMDELYAGEYRLQSGLVHGLCADHLCAPEALTFSASDYSAGLGSGWTYRSRFRNVPRIALINDTLQPRAGAIVKLAARDYQMGKHLGADQAQPVYLRDSVAWKN